MKNMIEIPSLLGANTEQADNKAENAGTPQPKEKKLDIE